MVNRVNGIDGVEGAVAFAAELDIVEMKTSAAGPDTAAPAMPVPAKYFSATIFGLRFFASSMTFLGVLIVAVYVLARQFSAMIRS